MRAKIEPVDRSWWDKQIWHLRYEGYPAEADIFRETTSVGETFTCIPDDVEQKWALEKAYGWHLSDWSYGPILQAAAAHVLQQGAAAETIAFVTLPCFNIVEMPATERRLTFCEGRQQEMELFLTDRKDLTLDRCCALIDSGSHWLVGAAAVSGQSEAWQCHAACVAAWEMYGFLLWRR